MTHDEAIKHAEEMASAWWNAPYKEPSSSEISNKSEIPGSIVKKDLGVELISKADALALFCDKCSVYNCISKCLSYRAVEKMSSVTPIRPRGYWIENAPEYQNIDPPYICSECGNMHLRKTNYCDQCGADMREVKDGKFKD